MGHVIVSNVMNIEKTIVFSSARLFFGRINWTLFSQVCYIQHGEWTQLYIFHFDEEGITLYFLLRVLAKSSAIRLTKFDM